MLNSRMVNPSSAAGWNGDALFMGWVAVSDEGGAVKKGDASMEVIGAGTAASGRLPVAGSRS